jgi:hypothetical protein
LEGATELEGVGVVGKGEVGDGCCKLGGGYEADDEVEGSNGKEEKEAKKVEISSGLTQ